MTLKLYELTEQYDKLLHDKVDTVTGELFDPEIDFKAKLAEIKDKIEVKAENLGKLYLMLDGDLNAVNAEVARLTAKRETLKNKMSWIKQYLLDQLTLSCINEVSKPTIKIAIRTNQPSVEIVDPQLLPEGYFYPLPPMGEPNKTAILKHFKETGETVPGSKIITDKKRVDIK